MPDKVKITSKKWHYPPDADTQKVKTYKMPKKKKNDPVTEHEGDTQARSDAIASEGSHHGDLMSNEEENEVVEGFPDKDETDIPDQDTTEENPA
jgi:hypothetical protein